MSVQDKNKKPNSLASMVDDFWSGGMTPKDDIFTKEWMPLVNIKDDEDIYEIELAVPGFKKEEIEVSVDNGLITISALSEKTEEKEEEHYTRREFSSSSFTKSFSIPKDASEDDVQASYEDGVLRVDLHKINNPIDPKKTIEIK